MAKYAPLVLPAILHDMPQNYDQIITTYGAEGEITAKQHLTKINDILDLKEIDHDDAKMRFLAQSFTGKVKFWYRGLAGGSIRDYADFETAFLDKWEAKKNPQHFLTQYKNLKKNPNETI